MPTSRRRDVRDGISPAQPPRRCRTSPAEHGSWTSSFRDAHLGGARHSARRCGGNSHGHGLRAGLLTPANPAAVERIYEIKRRPGDLELTLLAATITDLEQDVELDASAHVLAVEYWPGALSIVCRLRHRRWAIPRNGATLTLTEHLTTRSRS